MKKDLFDLRGPPIDPPNWSSVSGCLMSSYLFAASSESSRLYSKIDPRSWLLPDLLTTVMLPPEPKPLSAGARPELTRNSATDSIDVCRRNCDPVEFR